MEKNIEHKFLTMEMLLDAEEQAHRHLDLELIYMLEGEVNLSIEEKIYRLKAEDIILINSRKKHRLYHVIGTKKQSLICRIYISWIYLRNYVGNTKMLFWCSSIQDMEINNYNTLRKVLQDLLIDYANGADKQYFYRQSLHFQILHQLVNFFGTRKEESLGQEDENKNHMDEMTDYLEHRYNQDVSLSELADYMNLSTAYISRYFKKKIGMNFVDYLYEIRLNHAAENLLDSEKQITTVAMDHGFPNVAAFNRLFKQKYKMTPSEYRRVKKQEMAERLEEKRNREKRARIVLQDYLRISNVTDHIENTEAESHIRADINKYEAYIPIWNVGINLGPAEAVLNSNLQQAVLYGKRYLGYKYGRIWSLFTSDMYIVGAERQGRFSKLDRILSFLTENDIIPIIELGEKQNRIQKSVTNYIRESDNISQFQNYDEFLQTFEDMMEHLVSYYTEQQINKWIFEVWDDRRVEVYNDKRPYLTLYMDVYRIVKKYAPEARVGGAGNYLGWFHEHTEEAIRRWIDGGVYPDFLTFTYSPYTLGDIQSERMSKRKSDEDDLRHVVDDLNKIMLSCGFPKRKVYISEWNMTSSSRNYFNDSLWKACYIVKCCIDSLGKVDALMYSQLSDSTTDYYDDQSLLNGSGGLLSRDLIEKPAFMAMRLLRHLQKFLVAVGEDYIITRDEYGKITIIMHNFIRRSSLYYLKEEYENTLPEHYTYFEHQNKKKLRFELHNLFTDTIYDMHHHVVNRNNGSIMDKWADFGFQECLQMGDVEYMRRISVPKLFSVLRRTEGDTLSFDIELEPLEIRCISLKPVKK